MLEVPKENDWKEDNLEIFWQIMRMKIKYLFVRKKTNKIKEMRIKFVSVSVLGNWNLMWMIADWWF